MEKTVNVNVNNVNVTLQNDTARTTIIADAIQYSNLRKWIAARQGKLVTVSQQSAKIAAIRGVELENSLIELMRECNQEFNWQNSPVPHANWTDDGKKIRSFCVLKRQRANSLGNGKARKPGSLVEYNPSGEARPLFDEIGGWVRQAKDGKSSVKFLPNARIDGLLTIRNRRNSIDGKRVKVVSIPREDIPLAKLALEDFLIEHPEHTEFIQLFAAGYTYQEMARHFKCHTGKIEYAVEKMRRVIREFVREFQQRKNRNDNGIFDYSVTRFSIGKVRHNTNYFAERFNGIVSVMSSPESSAAIRESISQFRYNNLIGLESNRIFRELTQKRIAFNVSAYNGWERKERIECGTVSFLHDVTSHHAELRRIAKQNEFRRIVNVSALKADNEKWVTNMREEKELKLRELNAKRGV